MILQPHTPCHRCDCAKVGRIVARGWRRHSRESVSAWYALHRHPEAYGRYCHPELRFRMTEGLRSFFPPRIEIRCAAERFARKMKSPALVSAGQNVLTVGPAYPDFDLVGPSRIVRERSGLQRPGFMEGRASGLSLPPLVVTLAPCPSPGNQQGSWTGTSSHG